MTLEYTVYLATKESKAVSSSVRKNTRQGKRGSCHWAGSAPSHVSRQNKRVYIVQELDSGCYLPSAFLQVCCMRMAGVCKRAVVLWSRAWRDPVSRLWTLWKAKMNTPRWQVLSVHCTLGLTLKHTSAISADPCSCDCCAVLPVVLPQGAGVSYTCVTLWLAQQIHRGTAMYSVPTLPS